MSIRGLAVSRPWLLVGRTLWRRSIALESFFQVLCPYDLSYGNGFGEYEDKKQKLKNRDLKKNEIQHQSCPASPPRGVAGIKSRGYMASPVCGYEPWDDYLYSKVSLLFLFTASLPMVPAIRIPFHWHIGLLCCRIIRTPFHFSSSSWVPYLA